MYSSEDLERFYFQFQAEALPRGESFQSFCVKIRVSYNIFNNGLRIFAQKSLYYGSDAGAEMAATYHSVMGTVKFHGNSIWNFIRTFFNNIFNGCRDYVNLVPNKIVWPPSNVKIGINFLIQLSLGHRKVP